MADAEAKFITGSLLRHIAVMSSTSSIGLMAIFLVDLVDMLFISMLGQAELAAAIGYAGAILFFTTSISIGMAITAGALMSRSLGAKAGDRARELFTHISMMTIVVGIVVAVAVWLNLDSLTALMGAEGTTQTLAIRYLAIIVPSMPFLALGMVGSAALRAHGDAQRAMYATLSGGLINAVLDPILIFGLGLGLDGAAYSSVVARISIMVVALWPIFRLYGGVAGVNVAAFVLDVRPMLAIAIPAILTNVATPIGSAYATRMMAEFGEVAVAGMAIVGRLTPVAFAMIFALSGAIGPIFGQNYGAGNHDRVRKTFDESVLFTAGYVLFVAGTLFLLRAPIADVFGVDGVARTLVYLFCGPLALGWFFVGIVFIGNATFNNLGHPYYSTWINWGRNTLGTIPFVYFGAQFWGAPGVLIGQMGGSVIFAFVSWRFAVYVMDKAIAQGGELPSGTFAVRGRLLQLFHLRR